MSEKRGNPLYTGVTKHLDKPAGFALWYPTDWTRYDMGDGHHGVIVCPKSGDMNTYLSAEKTQLKYKVQLTDVPTLREGFQAGLQAMPGIEIESQDEAITKLFKIFEARFTFLEGDVRRKRWVRLGYWSDGLLTLIAQGETPEEFDYWLPMFFNTMMTLEFD
jgi:hypothetical protein